MSWSAPQPPGWYHAHGDPPATHRWWDGTQWVGGPVVYAPPPAYAPPPLAGFWRRVGAWLLDSLIIGVPSGLVRGIVNGAVPKHTTSCTDLRGRPAVCETPTTGGALVIIGASLVMFGAALAYYAYFNGTRGATLGKQACGLLVVDERTLQPIGTGRAIGRYFGSIVSTLPCLLGQLWVIWDDKKQTWHDKMVHSVVVRGEVRP